MRDLRTLITEKSKRVIIKEYGFAFWEYIDEEINGKNFYLWKEFIEMFVENINLGGRLLDLGCGFGTESMLLSPYCEDITAVDINEEKILVFKKLLGQTGIKNIKPIVANAEKLPFEKESFDIVFCNESLSHVSDIKKVLVEIRRVLKQNGQIIVAETKRWNPYGLWMIYIRRDFEEKYFNTWVMRRLLYESGFRNIRRVKYITAPRDPFRHYRKILWPLLTYIDPKYVFSATKK